MRALFLALLTALVACSSSGMTPAGDGELLGLVITPEEAWVPMGSAVQLKAIGLYPDRETRDLTNVVSWASADPSTADVLNALDEEGLVQGNSLGTTEVWAWLDDVQSPQIPVTVTDQSVTALDVEPGSVDLEPGGSVQLGATATWTDGSRTDATGMVRWVTGNGNVATIDDGLLTGQGQGETTITAQYNEIVSENVPVTVVAGAVPDLQIGTLSASASGDDLTVTVEVENTGSAGVGGFYLDVFLDPSGAVGVGDVGDAWTRVDWVGAGESVQFAVDLTSVSEGEHTIAAYADTEDEIAESNESNNDAELDVDVSGGGGGTSADPTDLVVDWVDGVTDGIDIYYWVEIRNDGDVGAGPFWVDLYVDETFAPAVGVDGDDWAQVTWIGPQESLAIEFLVPATCTWCWSWVQVDTLDEIAEGDESNNVYGPVDVYYY